MQVTADLMFMHTKRRVWIAANIVDRSNQGIKHTRYWALTIFKPIWPWSDFDLLSSSVCQLQYNSSIAKWQPHYQFLIQWSAETASYHLVLDKLARRTHSWMCTSVLCTWIRLPGWSVDCDGSRQWNRRKVLYRLCNRYEDLIQIIANDFDILSLELQSASLAYLYAVGDRVRFGITRPIGSFDYVLLHCISNESFALFNNTIPDSGSPAIIECSFLSDVPLINLVLETFKHGFISRVLAVTQESKMKHCRNRSGVILFSSSFTSFIYLRSPITSVDNYSWSSAIHQSEQ